MKLMKAFYQLVAFGKWQLIEAFESEIKLYKSTKLFDIESEQWRPAKDTYLTLYKKGKFKLEGELSWYDLEVLEMLKFERID